MSKEKHYLKNCQGPFVIIGRPHSGTRFLAEAFIKNGIFIDSRISKGFQARLAKHLTLWSLQEICLLQFWDS